MLEDITLKVWELIVLYVSFLGLSMIAGSFFGAMLRHIADSIKTIKDKR